MRAYQDLREFLSVLEQERQLLRIADPVKLEPDLASAACALTKLGESSPAILFNNISGYTKAQVAMNTHGSRGRIMGSRLAWKKMRRCATSSSSLPAATSNIRARWSTSRPRRVA